MGRIFLRKYVSLDLAKSLENNDKLKQLKAEVISILKKHDEKEVKKAIEYIESMEDKYSYLEKSASGEWIEKAGYGVGTVRIWKGKKYKKVSASPTRWVRVFDKVDRGAKSSMTRLINKVNACNSEEELYQFCLQNHAIFQDENGVDLPIMDRLREAIDNKKNGSSGSVKPTNTKQVKEDNKKTEVSPENTAGGVNEDGVYVATAKDGRRIEVEESDENGFQYTIYDKDGKELDGGYAYDEDSDDDEITEFDNMSLEEASKKFMEMNNFEVGEADKPAETKEPDYTKMTTTELEKINKESFNKFRESGDEEALEIHKKASKQISINETKLPYKRAMKGNSKEDNLKYLDEKIKNTEQNIAKTKKSIDKTKDFQKRNQKVDLLHGYEEDLEALKQLQVEVQESEAEKHENRSNAMLGNQNAYKGGPKEEFDEGYKTATDNATRMSVKEIKEAIKWWETSIKENADSPAIESYKGQLQAYQEALKTKEAEEAEKKNKVYPANKYTAIPSISDPDNLQPVASNSWNGEGEVKMPYSKELNSAIKSLESAKEKSGGSTRAFLEHIYYQNGNLVATDGRRLKILKVGVLDGIENESFVEIENTKDGVKIKKMENKTDMKFPEYSRVVPKNNNQQITLDNKALKKKIKELKDEGAISKNKNNPNSMMVSLEIENGNLMLDGVKVGSAKDVTFDDGKPYFNMNAEYLENALVGDTATLMASNDASKVMTINTNSSMDIIMPMQKNIREWDDKGNMSERENKADYSQGREYLKNKRETDSKVKEYRVKQMDDYIEYEGKHFTPEKVAKLINTINDKSAQGHEGIIKHTYEAMKKAEKQYNHPTNRWKNELYTDNRYGFTNLAIAMNYPDFKEALENMAGEYGLVKKSLFDCIDFEVVEDDEDEEFKDYSAIQPELFNSMSYKVGCALDNVFNC